MLLFVQPLVSVIDATVNLSDSECCSECSNDGSCGNNNAICSCGSPMLLNLAAASSIPLPLLETSNTQMKEILLSQLVIFSIFHPPTVI
jgi:hypothetical protein